MSFLKLKNIHIEQEAQKTKIIKRDLKEKTRQETKTRERIDETNFVIEYFDVVLFMKQKPRIKRDKERGKNKEPKESKKDRQEGRKNQKSKRETENEKVKKGEAKRLRRNKGRHCRITKNALLWRERWGFSTKAKKGKEKQLKQEKQKKTQKYQKMSFSVISQIFFFGGCPNFPFSTTWPKKRVPPKTPLN